MKYYQKLKTLYYRSRKYNPIGKRYPYQRYSFSQCGEDLILQHVFQRILKIEKPTYMDIGAYHPFFLSNTALFYTNGSHGINIEPDIHLFRPFKRYRSRDVNLNIAISDRNEVKPLYIMTIPTLNTLSLEEANRNSKLYDIKIERTEEKQCHTIEYVLEHYFNQKMPDLLSIDVEGFELEIFQSFDLKQFMPKVICVEAYDIHKNKKEIRHDLLNYLRGQDFSIYADTGLNVILTSGF